MPSIGILESDENVLWFSSSTMTNYMGLITHACSFASNIQDGRLEEICHTPFKDNTMYLDIVETHQLFIVAKNVMDKKEEVILYFCLDYAERELKRKDLARTLLELFVDKFFEKFIHDLRRPTRFLENVKKNQEDFTKMCDAIFKEVIKSYELFSAEGIDFLIDQGGEKEKELNLLFAAVSVQGLPIAAKFFDSITDTFRVSITDNGNTESILQNLISAQLSTLSYQALIQGTMCNYIRIKFTDLASLKQRYFTVNFFPISDKGGNKSSIDDYSFIMMSEGDPNLARFFQSSVTPLLIQTGLLKEKFTGNVAKYKDLDTIIASFPKKMDFESDV